MGTKLLNVTYCQNDCFRVVLFFNEILAKIHSFIVVYILNNKIESRDIYLWIKCLYKIKNNPKVADYQMASTKGFEPLTARLEGVCSIQLSYVDIAYFQLLN